MPTEATELDSVDTLSVDPEDLLSDSLQTLYDYQPIVLTTPGAPFTYTCQSQACLLGHGHNPECAKPFTISLLTPDTAAANWALQASSIWASSMYLADHLADLHLDDYIRTRSGGNVFRVLELGASAGLPSILIGKLHPEIMVTATDYPDEALIQTLSENVKRNDVAQTCRVFPFAWGTDPTPILHEGREKFDVVIAADTLWNPDFHEIFIDALKSTLKKTFASRIHLIVGLHTGRYTIGSFLRRASKSGFDVESATERQITGSLQRDWNTDREDDEKERRKWIIWIQLKWTTTALELEE